jgi:hypothetical protein
MYKINNAGGNAKDKQFPMSGSKKGKKEKDDMVKKTK